MKERLIFSATLLGVAAAVFAIGYSLGKDTNEGTTSFLREKYAVAEKTETQLRAENTSLRVELEATRGTASSKVVSLAGPASGVSSANARLETISTEIEIRAGSTETVSNGAIAISLIGTSFAGSPLRHKVTASLGSTGKEAKSLEQIDVGFATEFNGYEVRLLSSGSGIAKFLVTKLGAK